MMTDPVADMLTRVRNAYKAKHTATLMPASRLKQNIAQILKQEGYIRDFEVVNEEGAPQATLRIHLKYDDSRAPAINGLRRVSKPGLRVFKRRQEIPRVLGGLGTVIISTPKGLMTGREAWRQNVGGEVIAYVW